MESTTELTELTGLRAAISAIRQHWLVKTGSAGIGGKLVWEIGKWLFDRIDNFGTARDIITGIKWLYQLFRTPGTQMDGMTLPAIPTWAGEAWIGICLLLIVLGVVRVASMPRAVVIASADRDTPPSPRELAATDGSVMAPVSPSRKPVKRQRQGGTPPGMRSIFSVKALDVIRDSLDNLLWKKAIYERDPYYSSDADIAAIAPVHGADLSWSGRDSSFVPPFTDEARIFVKNTGTVTATFRANAEILRVRRPSAGQINHTVYTLPWYPDRVAEKRIFPGDSQTIMAARVVQITGLPIGILFELRLFEAGSDQPVARYRYVIPQYRPPLVILSVTVSSDAASESLTSRWIVIEADEVEKVRIRAVQDDDWGLVANEATATDGDNDISK